jgi:hypothetical protein
MKTVLLIYLLINNISYSISLNKPADAGQQNINNTTIQMQIEEMKEKGENLKFNYSLLIAILSVCIGFLLSVLWLIFALIYHK